MLALLAARGVGPATVRRLLAEGADLEDEIARLSPTERDRALDRAAGVQATAASSGIVVLGMWDDGYPGRLLRLDDPPPVVFTLGEVRQAEGPSVALVGSREATPYGLRVTRRLASAMAVRGVSVVSGLALGIDAEAHVGALDAGGHTLAVMGTGVDVPYPSSHAELHARVAGHGGLLSELPPGARAHPGAFPRRNRLIAAMADVTVVVQAGSRSGALITARLAGELGRTVGAVPGPVDVDRYEGSNGLLRDGAQVVTGPDDLVSLLALATPAPGGGDPQARRDSPTLAPTPADSPERRVLDVLRAGPRPTDEIAAAAGLAPREVVQALASLELLGLARVDVAGVVVRE